MTRRQWLNVTACLGVSTAEAAAARAGVDGPEPPPADAQSALARLKAGNRRFTEGRAKHTHENASWRTMLVEGQKPFATILGCSDSGRP